VTYGVHGIPATCLVLYARDQCMTVSPENRNGVTFVLHSRILVPGVTYPNSPVKLLSTNLLMSVCRPGTALEMGEHRARKRSAKLFPRQGYTSPRCRHVDRTPAAQRIYPFTGHPLTGLGKFGTVSWSSGYSQRARLQVLR